MYSTTFLLGIASDLISLLYLIFSGYYLLFYLLYRLLVIYGSDVRRHKAPDNFLSYSWHEIFDYLYYPCTSLHYLYFLAFSLQLFRKLRTCHGMVLTGALQLHSAEQKVTCRLEVIMMANSWLSRTFFLFLLRHGPVLFVFLYRHFAVHVSICTCNCAKVGAVSCMRKVFWISFVDRVGI